MDTQKLESNKKSALYSLELYIAKTKELCCGQTCSNHLASVHIQHMEQVWRFKFLRTVTDNCLSFGHYAFSKKTQLHLLRKLRNFNICNEIEILVYRSPFENHSDWGNISPRFNGSALNKTFPSNNSGQMENSNNPTFSA